MFIIIINNNNNNNNNNNSYLHCFIIKSCKAGQLISRVFFLSILWLWRWLQHKLSKRRSQLTTVLISTTQTRPINQLQTPESRHFTVFLGFLFGGAAIRALSILINKFFVNL